MLKRAFSLLELMVVIGLVAFLLAIAVPYYSDYVNKSKVALAAIVLNDLNTKAMALYNEGLVTPGITSITIDGATFIDNVETSIANAHVNDVVFFAPGDGSVNDNAWAFCAFISDLSFFSDLGGPSNRLCSKVVISNGIFTTYCGSWTQATSGVEVPTDYLPDQCNYTEVSSY